MLKDKEIKENSKDISIEFSSLRDKLWREDKIRIQGLTFSEWKEFKSNG